MAVGGDQSGFSSSLLAGRLEIIFISGTIAWVVKNNELCGID